MPEKSKARASEQLLVSRARSQHHQCSTLPLRLYYKGADLLSLVQRIDLALSLVFYCICIFCIYICVYVYFVYTYVCVYFVYTYVYMYILPKRYFFVFLFFFLKPLSAHFSQLWLLATRNIPSPSPNAPAPGFAGSMSIGTAFNCDHIFPDLFLYLLSFNKSSVNSSPRISRSEKVLAQPFQYGKTAWVTRRTWAGLLHRCEVYNVVTQMGGSTRKEQTIEQTNRKPPASFKEWGIVTTTQEPLAFSRQPCSKACLGSPCMQTPSTFRHLLPFLSVWGNWELCSKLVHLWSGFKVPKLRSFPLQSWSKCVLKTP